MKFLGTFSKKALAIATLALVAGASNGFASGRPNGAADSGESYDRLIHRAAAGEIHAVRFIESDGRFFQVSNKPLSGLVVFHDAIFKVVDTETSVNNSGVTVIRYELEYSRGRRLSMDVYSLHNRAGKRFYHNEPDLNPIERLLLKGLVDIIVS